MDRPNELRARRCIYCNGDRLLVEFIDNDPNFTKVYLACFTCGASGPTMGTVKEAIMAWNQDLTPTVLEETATPVHARVDLLPEEDQQRLYSQFLDLNAE